MKYKKIKVKNLSNSIFDYPVDKENIEDLEKQFGQAWTEKSWYKAIKLFRDSYIKGYADGYKDGCGGIAADVIALHDAYEKGKKEKQT